MSSAALGEGFCVLQSRVVTASRTSRPLASRQITNVENG